MGKGELHREGVFDMSEKGVAEFSRYVAGAPGSLFYVLADMVRGRLLPGKHSLRARRGPARAAGAQARPALPRRVARPPSFARIRDPRGPARERILYMSFTNTQLFQPWLEAFPLQRCLRGRRILGGPRCGPDGEASRFQGRAIPDGEPAAGRTAPELYRKRTNSASRASAAWTSPIPRDRPKIAPPSRCASSSISSTAVSCARGPCARRAGACAGRAQGALRRSLRQFARCISMFTTSTRSPPAWASKRSPPRRLPRDCFSTCSPRTPPANSMPTSACGASIICGACAWRCLPPGQRCFRLLPCLLRR